MWPQIIWISLTMISVGIGLKKSKKGTDFIIQIIAVSAVQTLLYFGGFYDCFLN